MIKLNKNDTEKFYEIVRYIDCANRRNNTSWNQWDMETIFEYPYNASAKVKKSIEMMIKTNGTADI